MRPDEEIKSTATLFRGHSAILPTSKPGQSPLAEFAVVRNMEPRLS